MATGKQVTDIGDECYSRADANAKLQKSQPEWYGPYLDEGEKYLKPRSAENLAQAYEEMKLDDIPAKYAHLRPQIEELIYRYWVLFDGKMRAIRGVELDLDLSGVKPIRLQPYRWSPVKMEGGRKLLDDFQEQGLIEPATSAWGAPALLVLKPHTTPAESKLSTV